MQRQMLIIHLDGDYYGIDVRLIQEVIKNYSLRLLPDAPNFIEGIISLRDHIVPLIKIKRLLNIPLFDLYKNKKVIILHFGEEVRMGLMVDEVIGIHYYEDSEIRPVDTVSRSQVMNYVIGVVEKDNRKVAILDVFSMFFSNKGEFLYKQYFNKTKEHAQHFSKKDYYLLQTKVEENNFPFTEFTQQGIIKYINRIASLRGESVERVLKDRSIFQNSHFSLTQDRIFLFENKADMFMINDLFETQLKDKKEIKIWVLGNAGGYDAYSISLLYEAFDFNLKTLEIINSDDNLKGLIRGREAKLPKSALAYIPVTLWPVYFKQEKETFTLSKDVRDNVIFDFYKPNPRFQPSGVDLIYAPNYLARNKEQRNLLLRNFYRALNPGGILALGLFENIEGLVKNLKKYYIKNRLVFIKES